jgi:flagellar operon protein (TIGR03826 family)
MSEFKNCVKCGRLFKAEMGVKFCSRCLNDSDAEYQLVKEYLYDHPNSNIVEVSEATNVDEDKILKYLREGKLMVKGEGILLECERCGETINTGRFCRKCTKELESGLRNAANSLSSKAAPSKSQGFHIKDSEKK